MKVIIRPAKYQQGETIYLKKGLKCVVLSCELKQEEIYSNDELSMVRFFWRYPVMCISKDSAFFGRTLEYTEDSLENEIIKEVETYGKQEHIYDDGLFSSK